MSVIFVIVLYMQLVSSCLKCHVGLVSISSIVLVFRSGSILVIRVNVLCVRVNSSDIFYFYIFILIYVYYIILNYIIYNIYIYLFILSIFIT